MGGHKGDPYIFHTLLRLKIILFTFHKIKKRQIHLPDLPLLNFKHEGTNYLFSTVLIFAMYLSTSDASMLLGYLVLIF